jgi:hypothetical protein
MAKVTKRATAAGSKGKTERVSFPLSIDESKLKTDTKKPTITDMAEGILRLLSGYTPDEQTSILNQLVKFTAINRMESMDMASKHANQCNAELKNFCVSHPSAEKYIKEHGTEK